MTLSFRAGGAAFATALALATPALPALADPVNGTGRAPITKDVETVRNVATAEARRQIVVAMLTQVIGADRLREVAPQTIEAIAAQLRADMITGQSSRREGTMFVVELTADVDGAWFRGLLDAHDIDSSSRRADGDRATIFVMLDQVDDVASDFATPAETETSYERQTGGSFADRSSVTASSRESAAASSRSASAYSNSGSGAFRSSAAGAARSSGAAAYGASGTDGSAAGRARSNSASGYSASAAGAYTARAAGAAQSASSSARSSAASFADRTDIQAKVHDDVRFHTRTVYQRPAANSDGDAIMSALKGSLGAYGVVTADSWAALSSYFANQPPRYAALKRDARYQPFLTSLSSRNAPFFLGGTFAVTHAGKDMATGQARCSGRLDATAFATVDGRDLASGMFNATATGMSPQECGSKLAEALGRQAAAGLGPRVQNHWRSVARAAVGQDTSQLAEYALVLRATSMNMAMQADVLDALQGMPGVQGQNFVSATGTEMRFTVRYSGAMPLQLAIYQKLRGRPGFADMQANAEGRSVTLCLSGCGAAR